jgi:glycosyltransferase involved in cell wall biosynthesis
MRFHLVSLPHTQVTSDFAACAFTEKIRKFAVMMMNLGHEVILYAGDQNEAPCTELVTCFSEADRLAHCGGKHFIEASWDWSNPGWVNFNTRVIAAIRQRAQPRDFICVIGGLASKPIADALPDMMTVEFGIGYGGTFAKYRVWESYAWMHTCYGAATKGNPNAADGQWFDAVIPGYFEPENFPFRADKDDYYFFIGRLTDRKGYRIASEVCQRLSKRLIVAGQGTPPEYGQYVGVIGPDERGRLMAGATAVFVPTIYVEPFGNVAVEAQACGTPVITTDWGAMTETVVEGVTGFHCRTFGEFCAATESVKALDPYAIRKHVMERYTLDVIGKKYDAYFNRLSTLWGDGWYA